MYIYIYIYIFFFCGEDEHKERLKKIRIHSCNKPLLFMSIDREVCLSIER